MKRQKRFETEQEIVDAIDDCHNRSKELIKLAEQQEAQAGDHFAIAAKLFELKDEISAGKGCYQRQLGDDCKTQAKKARISAANLIEIKARKLGQALAAFRTLPIEEITKGDNSVVLTSNK